jgi:hypothetical protein
VSARGYQLHPAATEELDAAGEWYDAQRPGLNLELLDAVEEAIALIVERPAAWQRDSVVAGREIHRFVMRRFPFSIVYYVVEGKPQRYGTQFKGGKPQPIEDEANVDARRKAIGLNTMAEYAKDMERMYGKPPPAGTGSGSAK